MSVQQPIEQPVTFGGCVINSIGVMFFLVGVMIAMPVYENLVQRPLCYDYAARKQLPDLEFLEYNGVVLRSNQFQGHVCRFTDTRTGFPVNLRFDEADIPTGTDTMNVFAMIAGAAIAGGAYFLVVALIKRAGRRLWNTIRP
ncbi:MAG: hypothetical protein OHK0022_07610 [Roseiflexaceae bacterium]